MIQGFVNQNCEAIIRVAVGHANSPKQMVEAIIDKGFTGFLSLPIATITDLGLPWYFRDVGTLGDGSQVIFEEKTVSRISIHSCQDGSITLKQFIE